MTMNNTLSKIIVFTAGAAVGSAITWKIVKTKYEKIAQEEINSVKDYYAARQGKASTNPKSEETEEESFDDEELEEYEGLIAESGYIVESNIDKIQNDGEDVKKMDERPYVMSPEEYDEIEYEKLILHYHANDVIVDDLTGGVIDKEDWDEMIGLDFADHFGDYDYDPDTVYICNDKFGIAYEIQKELDDYPEDN